MREHHRSSIHGDVFCRGYGAAAVRRKSITLAAAVQLFLMLSRTFAHAQSAKLENAEQILSMFGFASSDIGELPAVDLVVDDSKSMRGFVQSQQGDRYRAVVDQLLQNAIGDSMTIRRLSAPRHESIRHAADLFEPAFYVRDDTPLDRAFLFAKANATHITILLSDLEQSTGEDDVRAAEAALVSALDKKKAVLLLGVRSAFNNQQRPQCSPACPAQQRYFYVIVMAPSPAILRSFVDRTRLDKFAFDDTIASPYGPTLFYSSRPALEVDRVDLDSVRGPWKQFRDVVHTSGADQTFDRLQASFSYRYTWPVEALKLRVHIAVHDPVQDLSHAVPKMAEIRRPGPPMPREIPASGLSHSAEGQTFARDKTVSFEYKFPQPRPHTWSIYRVWFISRRANIEIPLWVKKCSEQAPATKDAYPAVAALVRTMIREVTEKEPMMEHFIAIGQD
jgi:hypothetical protein